MVGGCHKISLLISLRNNNDKIIMKLSLALLAAASALGASSAFFVPHAPVGVVVVGKNNRASSSTSSSSSSSSSSLQMTTHLRIQTGKSQLDTAVINRFNSLPYPTDKILAEYVWVDAKGDCRSKSRTLPSSRGKAVDMLPRWNFDGSSTGQAPGDDSEVILRPCRIFRDPFRPRDDGNDNILVMCDTYTPAGVPLPTNTRAVGE